MRRTRGFTLLELMIVVVIAAVLLTLAGPGLRALLLASARSDVSTSLYGAMVLARAEAITRNAQVTICQRDSAKGNAFPRCNAGSSGNWAQGWVVYRDSKPNDSGSKPYAAADVIAAGDPANASFVITSTPADTRTLQFDASGRVSAASSIDFRLCRQASAEEGRDILVELSGHIALMSYKSCRAI